MADDLASMLLDWSDKLKEKAMELEMNKEEDEDDEFGAIQSISCLLR